MNILILSRGPQLYSTQSLLKAGLKRRHYVRIVDYMECSLVVEQGKPQIHYKGELLEGVDAIIPRIGTSATFFGTAVVQQFEMMGACTTTSSEGLMRARNKFRAYQLLCNCGLGMPRTVFSNNMPDVGEIIEAVGGVPLVVKLLKGTHGLGVVLARDYNTAESVIEAFNRIREHFIVQEFIPEAKGADVRALVVNGTIVAAMKRKARQGEFRSNLHRGASAFQVKLTRAEEDTALKATEILGLSVAGVDMLQSNRGPLILEVNPSPGLEGIETITRIEVAAKIIESLEVAVTAKENVKEQP